MYSDPSRPLPVENRGSIRDVRDRAVTRYHIHGLSCGKPVVDIPKPTLYDLVARQRPAHQVNVDRIVVPQNEETFSFGWVAFGVHIPHSTPFYSFRRLLLRSLYVLLCDLAARP